MESEKILLSIDVFDRDPTLLNYGLAVAKLLNAGLELFDVQLTARSLPARGLPGHDSPEIALKSTVFLQADTKMKELLKQANAVWRDTDYTLLKDMNPGKFAGKEKYWLEHINRNTYEMAILRMVVQGNLFQTLFGIAETKMIRRSECPLLLIPSSVENYRGFRNIAYLLRRDKPMDEVLNHLRVLAQLSDCGDSILQVYYLTDANGEAAELEMSVLASKISEENELKSLNLMINAVDNRESVIDQLVKREIIQLLVFDYGLDSWPDRLISRNIENRLINNAEMPVLVF